MAWADIADRISVVGASCLGQSVTYTDSSDVDTTVDCVIKRRAEPILRGGQIVILEDHYDGLIPASALSADPARGEHVTTAAGVVFEIDAPPELRDGMWYLILRREE